MRNCSGCGTPLCGPKFHGFVRGAKLVCGRSEQKRGGRDGNGNWVLVTVKTPECKA